VESVHGLIGEITLEHTRTIAANDRLQQALDDLTGQKQLETAREAFVPGRQDDQQKFERLTESLGLIDRGLRAHFLSEENQLLEAFEDSGEVELVAMLNRLLQEHTALRQRLNDTQSRVVELSSGGLSQPLWQRRVGDLRDYMSQTAQILARHAKEEDALFKKALAVLKKETQSGWAD
jgi:hemerythrin-like domain-containing protein